jgi:hypothetical protein
MLLAPDRITASLTIAGPVNSALWQTREIVSVGFPPTTVGWPDMLGS